MKRDLCVVMWCTGWLLGLSACGGAQTASAALSPPAVESEATRTVTGHVPMSGTVASSLSKDASSDVACVADAIHATDTSGVTVSTSVEDDCRFQLDLPIGKTYALSLSRGDAFVATLLFSAEDGLSSATLHLPDGETISLGDLLIAGPNAFPEFEPVAIAAEESRESGNDDSSATEEASSEVTEDTGNSSSGSNDTDEASDDESESPLSDSEPRLVQITPFSGARDVAPEAPLVVRASCELDADSISAAIFSVGDAEGGHVECRVGLGDTPAEVRCEHDGLLAGEDYIVTVEGLQCAPDAEQDGSVRSMTWHFRTE